MWLLVKELLRAREATVQWIFIFQPLADRIVEHAIAQNEPEALVDKARRALKQPGNGAPHHDHVHVRVYCSKADKVYGCIDIGPLDLLAEREVEARDLELESVGRRLRRPSDGLR
jgi:penicillin-insensitive murein endopeptidase